MDDFYKKIKNELEGRSEEEFNTADWTRMEKKLEGQSKSRKSFLPIAWWLPFLFMLLGSQLWLFFAWKESNATIQQLVKNSSISEPSQQFNGLLDTIYYSQVIYKTDTIYLNQPSSVKKQNSYSIPKWPKIPLKPYNYVPIYLASANRILKPVGRQFSSIRQSPLHLGNNKLIQNRTRTFHSIQKSNVPADKGIANVAQYQFSVAQPVPYLSIGLLNDPSLTKGINIERGSAASSSINYPKRKINPFEDFRIQGFSMDGGIAYNILLNEHLDYKNDISLTLAGSIKFSKTLDGWLGVDYINQSYETNKTDDNLGIQPLDPPSPDLEFVSVELSRSSLIYSFGISYTHLNGKRLRPQIGFGISSTSLFASETLYEFENPLTNQEWQAEIQIPSEFVLANHAILKGGLKYALTDVWRVYVHAAYYHNLQSRHRPDLISLRAGLSYAF